MLDAVDDGVSRALAAVPRGHYVDGAGAAVSPPDVVHRDLRRAGIGPGMRVLEVGTGSGYTGAVLAELVGAGGLVVSVDIAPGPVERAAALHAGRAVSNVVVRTGDGHLGAPDLGPYDAVVAWASPTEIPAAWVRQCRIGAVICSPVYLAPVAGAIGHLLAVVGADGTLAEPRLAAASYADLATDPPEAGATGPAGVTGPAGATGPAGPTGRRCEHLPIHHVDAHEPTSDGGLAWVSTAWRGQYPGHRPEAALRMLREPGHTEQVELADPAAGADPAGRAAAWRDFRAYCTGRDPSNLTSFGVVGERSVTGIGFSSGLNAAAVTPDGVLLSNGPDSPALTKVRDCLGEWERSGRPGVDTLRAVLRPTGGGWQVRTTPIRLARRPIGRSTSPAGAAPFGRPARSGPLGRAPGGDQFP